MKNNKALVLFSGGLDSMLAVKILQAQGIEVYGICFFSNFFGCEKAKKAAKSIGIKLTTVDISNEILEIVKNPLYGYGKNLNPCIDCHGFMIKKASEFLQKSLVSKKNCFDFIVTGEVLGQRPFSQNKEALTKVEKIAGIEVLRPLSAKSLPETEIEKKGLIIRGRLFNISGRSRERQMELAEKYGIKEYESPAGGCALTDPEFSGRLMKMLEYWPECNVNDIRLLRHGRIFWLKRKGEKEHILIVVGRHETDNESLEKNIKKGDIKIELEDIAGPVTIIRSEKLEVRSRNNSMNINIPIELKKSKLKLIEDKSEHEILQIAGLLTGWYAVKARGRDVNLKLIKSN